MDRLATKDDLKAAFDRSESRMKLFVATTVIGSATVVVLVQTLVKVIGDAP